MDLSSSGFRFHLLNFPLEVCACPGDLVSLIAFQYPNLPSALGNLTDEHEIVKRTNIDN